MSAMPSVAARSPETYDVVVVGAGFAGMYMLHRLRGQGMTARVYEQGSGVGGTWYWNRYPGARCDVESMQYSYSFDEELQREWNWSERYAPQPEILQYANHVADRFNLRPDIQFNTRIERAVFDETTSLWSVTASGGNMVTAKFVVLATGCLSNARMPDIKGLDTFQGKIYHTGHWPHEEVDFTGPRVGVIGTGSSAIQSVPVIAEQASKSDGIPAHREFLHSRPQCGAVRGGAAEIPRQLSRDQALCARGGKERHLYRGARSRRARRRRQRASLEIPGALGPRRAHLHVGLQQSRARQGGQRHGGGFRPRKDRGDRRGPRDRKTAAAEQSSDRLQTHLHRHGLFRDLQSSERDAGGYQIQSDRGDHGECRACGRQRL